MNKMLIKIFMSRKNTKIYFIVVLLLALLFSTTNFLNRYYIQKNNENFKESYIFIPKTNYTKKKLKEINVKNVIEVKTNIESDAIYYNLQNDISKNTILVSNNTYNYLLNNNQYQNIEINICSNCFDNVLYISDSMFNNLNIKTIDGYYIILSDWSEVDKVIKIFDKERSSMDIGYSENYNANILGITKLLKILLIIIYTLVLILYIVILIDLILDGKNKSKLLYTLGLNCNRIIKLVIIQFAIYLIEFTFICSLLMLFSKCIV